MLGSKANFPGPPPASGNHPEGKAGGSADQIEG